MKYSDVLKDAAGAPRSGAVGVTFAIYAEREGGAPLWVETQNLLVDDGGKFSSLLGAATRGGLPADLFATGEARWLGVQVQLPGEVEQPRVLLVSVPYAMKAADADTLGGRPASDYVLRENVANWSGALGAGADKGGTVVRSSSGTSQALVSGTINFLGKFTPTGADMGNSQVFDDGLNVGIGTTSPSAQLHVSVTTAAARNALNTNVVLNNAAPLTGAVVSALNMQLIDQSTANNLSKQSARMVYIRGASATGGVLAFDSIFTTSAFLDANAPYTLRGGNFEFPRVTAGRTLGTYFGLYLEGPPAGNGTVTNKFALVTEPGAGNVGFGTTSPTEALDVQGVVRASGGVRFGDGTLQTTAATGGGGDITEVTPQAGGGMQGGGTSGAITNLSLLRTCTNNQILKWSGTAWACADDIASAGGSGDITAVIAGTGLTGGAASGDAILNANLTSAGGDNGTATTVARGDHLHDSRYLRTSSQAYSYSNSSLAGRYAFSYFGTDTIGQSLFVNNGIGTFQANGAGQISSGTLTVISSAGITCQGTLAGTYSVSSSGQGTISITVTTSSPGCVSDVVQLSIQVAQAGSSAVFARADASEWLAGTALRQ